MKWRSPLFVFLALLMAFSAFRLERWNVDTHENLLIDSEEIRGIFNQGIQTANVSGREFLILKEKGIPSGLENATKPGFFIYSDNDGRRAIALPSRGQTTYGEIDNMISALKCDDEARVALTKGGDVKTTLLHHCASGISSVLSGEPFKLDKKETENIRARVVKVRDTDAITDAGDETLRALENDSDFGRMVSYARLLPAGSAIVFRSAIGERVMLPSRGENVNSLLTQPTAISALSPYFETTPRAPVPIRYEPTLPDIEKEILNSTPILIAAILSLAIIYLLYSSIYSTKHKIRRKMKETVISEKLKRGEGSIDGKGESATRPIRLAPIFEVQIIDNVADDEGRISLLVKNICGEMIAGIVLLTLEDEVRLGNLNVGEEKKVEIRAGKSQYEKILIEFEPVVLGTHVFSRFEFTVKVERANGRNI